MARFHIQHKRNECGKKSIDMRQVFLLLILILFLGLFMFFIHISVDYNKMHIRSDQIGNSLYIETYQVYQGGVYDSDAYEIYLTDSSSFRKKLGDYDDNEWPSITVINDKVIIKWNDHQFLRYRKRNCRISILKRRGYDDFLHKQ